MLGSHAPPRLPGLMRCRGLTPGVVPPPSRKFSSCRAGDVYSFGVLLYEVTTGQPAWAGLTHGAVIQRVVVEACRPAFPPGTLHEVRAWRTKRRRSACRRGSWCLWATRRRLARPNTRHVSWVPSSPLLPCRQVAALAAACWQQAPEARPSFEQVLSRLDALLDAMGLR